MVLPLPRQAEVHQVQLPHFPVQTHKEVTRLDVPVHTLHLHQLLKHNKHLICQLQHSLHRKPLVTLLELMRETVPQQFHCDVGPVVVIPDAEQLRNAGLALQRCKHASFFGEEVRGLTAGL